MSAQIYKFTGFTTLDTEPYDALEAAKGKLKTVLVIGRDEKGELFIASSTGKIGIYCC